MKIIITENKLKQSLLKYIDEVGYIETSEIVGGFENLFNIIGEEKVVDLFISIFTDLHLTKRDDGITLYDWNLPMIKRYYDDYMLKTTLIVNDSSIALRVLTKLGDEGVALYKKYKDDFIKKLIYMFPELSDKSNLNENKLVKKLMNQVRENGWLETAELVGGVENLLSIVGESKVNVLNFLMSYFKNLRVEKRGGDVLLMDHGLPLLQKTSWGLPLRVYRGYLEARVPDENIPLLRHYIKDLVREFVLIYPELYSNNAEIFGDSGLYDRYGTFEL